MIRFDSSNEKHVDAIKQADAEAERARRDLWDTCSYPELKDRLVQVGERFRDLDVQRAHLESRCFSPEGTTSSHPGLT